MNWKTLESRELFRTPRSVLRVDKCELPDGRIMPDYYVQELDDWVNVVGLTPEGQLLLIKQYRHAIGEVTIELPGGCVDKEDGQDFEAAARRELVEETGYTAEKWIYAGNQFPNPAKQTNRNHIFLALNCRKTEEQSLDPFEDIEVTSLELSQLSSLITSGEIKNSIMVGSICLALLQSEYKNHLVGLG